MSHDQDQEEPNANTIGNLEEDSPATDAADSSVQDKLAGKTQECEALNNKYLRLAAEFENYKRLTQRDQREQIRFGNEQILISGNIIGIDVGDCRNCMNGKIVVDRQEQQWLLSWRHRRFDFDAGPVDGVISRRS